MSARASRTLTCLAGALATASCDGAQSTLVPAGRGAARIADLFWGMTIGLGAIWLGVVVLALYAYRSDRMHGPATTRRVIIGGGVVLPIVVLTGLLGYGLGMMPSLLPSDAPAAVTIQVTGHQYWWRVRYVRAGAPAVDLANELHLPAGARVELELTSRDVIHSFWVPALGGKVDMIPGRTTRLVLEPTEPGVYRGTCAEYCGASHAWMSFHVVVEEPAQFERWLAAQAADAPASARGAALFLGNGCGACHTIRGTPADGVIGPDLTHVGSRQALAAGLLPNDEAGLRRWIAGTSAIKPGVHMPAFGMLSEDTVAALATYLEGLR